MFSGGKRSSRNERKRKEILATFLRQNFYISLYLLPFLSLFYETRFIIFLSLIDLQSRFRLKLSKNHDNRVSTIYNT